MPSASLPGAPTGRGSMTLNSKKPAIPLMAITAKQKQANKVIG